VWTSTKEHAQQHDGQYGKRSRALARPVPQDFFESNVVNADFLTVPSTSLGTFDAIVGNPPYVSATQLSALRKQELLGLFDTAWGRLDLYALFFERAARLLAPAGRLAFITPDKFLTGGSSRPLRAFLAQRCPPRRIARFARHDVFPGVATIPAVTVLQAPTLERTGEAVAAEELWCDLDDERRPVMVDGGGKLSIDPDGRPWHVAPAVRRRRRAAVPLGTLVTRISAGLATGFNPAFVLPTERMDELEIEPLLLRKVVRGRDIQQGAFTDPGLGLLLPYVFDAGPPRLVDLVRYPGAAAHLAAHQAPLEARHCVRVWGKRWYDLHDPVTSDLTARPKLLVADLAKGSRFPFDPGGVLPLHSAYYMEPAPSMGMEPEALVALLNTPELEAELLRRAPIAKSG